MAKNQNYVVNFVKSHKKLWPLRDIKSFDGFIIFLVLFIEYERDVKLRISLKKIIKHKHIIVIEAEQFYPNFRCADRGIHAIMLVGLVHSIRNVLC